MYKLRNDKFKIVGLQTQINYIRCVWVLLLHVCLLLLLWVYCLLLAQFLQCRTVTSLRILRTLTNVKRWNCSLENISNTNNIIYILMN